MKCSPIRSFVHEWTNNETRCCCDDILYSLTLSKFRRQHVERDVDDHVFLPAHHLAPAELAEDRADVEPMVGGGHFGVAEEAGVDAGATQRQRLAIDA